MNKTLGSCRFLYNLMLAERIAIYQTLKDNREALYAHTYKTEKDYKQEHGFLKEADAAALQQARRNLEAAYANFFTSLKGVRKGGTVVPGREQNEQDAGETVYNRGGGKLSWAVGRVETGSRRRPAGG
ncbi:MAG: helix-turn-helix domain-containing protein [Treponema sp.]|nr:helix-turn-helix domain-containing protein [Treponema sp.]